MNETTGVRTIRCIRCPFTVEAFEEDDLTALLNGWGELDKHMEKEHGLNDEDQLKAQTIQCSWEEGLEGRSDDFLSDNDISEDDYERITGHQMWCTAGFNSQCQCGARPDMAEEKKGDVG